MKGFLSKVTAVLSAAVMMMGILPHFGVVASAEENNSVYSDSIQTGTDISVYGTDAFGNMLAAELQSAQDQQIENSGQNIFSVEMTGKTATVEYDVLDDCSVVVGIYDESGMKMLASGNADLSAEESTATLTINIGTMPQYFYIKAFLIDKKTMRPLCSVYENPMYTQEMQEFLAKTVDDFDADKVYNLDDDKTNNFAVFGENICLFSDNVVEGAVFSSWQDYDTGITYDEYYFNSIDDNIRALKPGDIYAYVNSKGKLDIDRVYEISISEKNNSFKIVTSNRDASVDLEDVFKYVKIDSSASQAGASLYSANTAKASNNKDEDGLVVDKDDSLEDGITCVDPVSIDGATPKFSLSYSFMDISLANYKNDDPFSAIETEANAKLSGSVSITLDGESKFYLNGDDKYVEFRLNYDVGANVNISGSASAKIQLFDMRFYFVPGVVYLSLKPSLIFEFSAKLEVTGNLTGTLGMQASEADGIKNISTAPQFNTKVEVSGKFYVGISLEPNLCVFADWIARAGMTAKVGAQISAKTQLYSSDTDKNYKHLCDPCLDGDVSAKFELSFSATFLNSEKLTLTIPVVDKTVKLFDYYYSKTFNEFALGECPHLEYKTIITVYDNTFNKINDAVITVDGKEISQNSYEASVFLKTGTHTFMAKSPNYNFSTKSAEIKAVSDKPNEVMLIMYKKDYSGNGGIDNSNQGGNQGGNGGSGENVDPIVNIGIQKNRLSLGGYHSAYITSNGDLYIWGDNGYGQLGYARLHSSSTPVKLMSNVAQVSLGLYHSACITNNGDLYTWGSNLDYQLGDNRETITGNLKKIMSNVSQVSLGDYHSACITTNGDLYTWGNNRYGQLGDGYTTDRYTPVKIMSNVSQVSLGGYHSACITNNRDLYIWGSTYCTKFGDHVTEYISVPRKYMSNVSQVSLGNQHSACIKTNGDLYIWNGERNFACLGKTGKIMSNVAHVSLGADHSAFITTYGELYTWGDNRYGQLGDKTNEDRYTPAKIMSNVSQVILGRWHSACITTNGDLYMWGENDKGQLGDGTAPDKYTPTKITIPTEPTSAQSALQYQSASSGENTQQFTGLLPNEVYNIYSMNSRKADEPFSSDNLLYIDQKISDSKGNLTVQTSTDKNGIAPEIFVKAMHGGEISNAKITSINESDGSVSIGWEAVEGAGKYTVYTIRNGIFIKEADTSGLSYTIDGLVGGTEYGFIVQAWVNGEYSVLDKSDAVYLIPQMQEIVDPITAFVERLYLNILNRPSDPSKVTHIDNLNNGESACKVAFDFVFSSEFAELPISNEERVRRMYLTFLNREPDPAGLADWTAVLDNGCSIGHIFYGFTQSNEFTEICEAYGINRGTWDYTENRDRSSKLTAFVSRLYTKAMGRAYDVNGLNDHTGTYLENRDLYQLAYNFIFSQEFIEKNLSDEDFVDIMYRTFFDREADPDGRADWLGKLKSGMSREEVLAGFVGSQECAELVAKFGI